ncbi:hypothetical protein L873DRAFT_905072 [Choiromyces venosus 120613-1]|uniref:Uncharacterized protein n=1 Tax=Choiromyces venosus 120613-1 TaxID=1336337 RepID=A0A3N4JMR2_9PEZI|nr:hypothetical protein L873DRAFT_905072 [Choiromyces venosus 120613-1]
MVVLQLTTRRAEQKLKIKIKKRQKTVNGSDTQCSSKYDLKFSWPLHWRGSREVQVHTDAHLLPTYIPFFFFLSESGAGIWGFFLAKRKERRARVGWVGLYGWMDGGG